MISAQIANQSLDIARVGTLDNRQTKASRFAITKRRNLSSASSSFPPSVSLRPSF